MPFGIDDAIIGSIGGSLISGLFGSSGQDSANETNIQLAKENRDFQERMSSTAYQRATKDMQAAGLNPMLAYSQGGASSPVGSMPQVQNVAAAGVSSAASGMALAQGVQSVLQSKAQTELIEAQARRTDSETMDKNLNTARLLAEIRGTGAKSDLDEKEYDYRMYADPERIKQLVSATATAEAGAKVAEGSWQADVDRRKAESTLANLGINEAKAQSDFFEHLGKSSPYLAWLLNLVKGVSGARSILK